MDIYCPICSEPVDHDELHEVAADQNRPYRVIAADYRTRGCEALDMTHNMFLETGRPTPEPRRDPVFGLSPAEAAGALYDILGEDMDGAAAMMEDMGF